MPDNVTPLNNTQFRYTEQAKTANSQLGKDEFLKLLIAQLQNQDPLAPQDNSQMIAQMAQFSTLEAMTNLTASFSQSQAYGMIGKGVIGLYRDTTTGFTFEVGGRVDSAGMKDGKAYVMVGELLLWADDISQVFDANTITGDMESLLTATSLVGKYIRATASTETGRETVEGLVERTVIKDNGVFVIIKIDGKDREIALFQITEVSNTEFPEAPAVEPETENETGTGAPEPSDIPGETDGVTEG